MSKDTSVKISLQRTPSFTEVWYEGFVTDGEIKYLYWLIDPQGKDDQGNEYSEEVRWFFKNVPTHIRALHVQILEQFKTIKNDTGVN